jgi:hypothetical protein
MMGRQTGDQCQLFYLFDLEERIPDNHLLRPDQSEFHNSRQAATGDPALSAGVDSTRLSASDCRLPPQGIARNYPGRYRRTLRYYVLPQGTAVRYGAIVGENGQAWSGVATVGRKEEWPGWTPTEGEKRRLGPLPNYVEGGASNPMGARALYLYANGKDTLYRIHGTNQPGWIGHAISSGCIRLTNEDVIDLYSRVKTGATVVVLGPKQGSSRLASANAL